MNRIEGTCKLLHVENMIKDFLFHCQYEKNLSKKTMDAYTIDLNQFQLYVKNSEIDIIEKNCIKSYLQIISKFKPKTAKRKIASLKAMFNYLEYENDNFINPFRKIKIRLKETYTLPTVMTINEVQKILQYLYRSKQIHKCKDCYSYKALVRHIAILELLFATGIRVSELCNLKIENIDLRYGVIKILGKGNKERIIQFCNPETKNSVKEYFLLFKDQLKSKNYFFVNRLGNTLSTQSVRLMLRQVIDKVGLTKKITPHTFRHTFATLLLEEDVDIRYIQGMLGHSTITTTQIYTHINSDKQKRILMAKHPRRKLSFDIE
jgi:integrase/recombinase XerD